MNTGHGSEAMQDYVRGSKNLRGCQMVWGNSCFRELLVDAAHRQGDGSSVPDTPANIQAVVGGHI